MWLFWHKSSTKYVYSFDEGKGVWKDLLGWKWANLAEMKSLGLPIPDWFTISTETCDIYYKNNKTYPQEVLDQVEDHLQKLEKTMWKKLWDAQDPLLVSVRSGAAVSMPWMMDTVLNLWLNDASVIGLANKTWNERFAWDSYRRFIQMFGDVVMWVEHHLFETKLQSVKDAKWVKDDTQLDVDDLQKVVWLYKEVIKLATGNLFPNTIDWTFTAVHSNHLMSFIFL